MKTRIRVLLLSALFASFALVSCKKTVWLDNVVDVYLDDDSTNLDGEVPGWTSPTIQIGEYTITITTSAFNNSAVKTPGYVKAFMMSNGEEAGLNRANVGDEIWIRASSYSGFEFMEWAGTVELSNPESNEIKFIMPPANVTLEAMFDDLSLPRPTPYDFVKTRIPADSANPENIKLRKWKAAQKRQVFGWYDAWSGRKDDGPNSMRGLPKEVTIVSNWGQPKTGLADWQKADQLYIQKVYGTKVVLTLFSAKVGDDIPGWSDTNIGTDTTESVIRPVISRYAKAIYDMCIKEEYDGYDWDFEPQASGQSVTQAPLWRVAKQAGIFLEELSYWFGTDAKKKADRNANGINRGAAPTRDLLLIVDGEVHNDNFKGGVNNTIATAYVNYYIQQAYGMISESQVGGRVNGIIAQVQAHIDNPALPDFTLEEAASRCIIAENWENATYAQSGGGVFTSAVYKHQGYDIGGFGAYRIGLGYAVSNTPYKGSIYYTNLRKAIDLQYGEGPREL